MKNFYFCGYNGFNHGVINDDEVTIKAFKCWMKGVIDSCASHTSLAVLTDDNKVILWHGSRTREDIIVDCKINCLCFLESCLLLSTSGKLLKYDFEDKQLKEIINFNKFRYDSVALSKKFKSTDNECFTNEEVKKEDLCGDILEIQGLMNGSILILLATGFVLEFHANNMDYNIKYVPEVDMAVKMCCGYEHVLFSTESGCVLAFGGGRGQLGLNDLSSTSAPIQVPALEGLKVTKVAAGGWHSACVTDDGSLYCWGWNNHGQLGLDMTDNLVTTPIPVDFGEVNIIDVKCGSRHTVVLTESGAVFGVGWNEYGQLGLNSNSDIHKFQEIMLPSGLRSSLKTLKCFSWCTMILEENKPDSV